MISPGNQNTSIDNDRNRNVVDAFFQNREAKGGKSRLVVEYSDQKIAHIVERKLAWYEKLGAKFELVDKVLTKLGVKSHANLEKIVAFCNEKGICNKNFQ